MAIIVFVTVPKENSKDLTMKILNERVCACVNLIRGVDSYFWWKGKIDQACEDLLLIKTKKKSFSKLERVIKENHPYSVPEILAVEADKINKEYLGWLLKEVSDE